MMKGLQMEEKKQYYNRLVTRINIIKSSYNRNKISELTKENAENLKLINRGKLLELEIKALENASIRGEINQLSKDDTLYAELRKEKKEFDKIKELKQRREYLVGKIEQTKESLCLSQENEETLQKIKELQKKIIQLQEMLNTNQMEKMNLTGLLQNAEQKKYKLKIATEEKETLFERKELYNNLSLITSKNGLSLHMLEYYLPLITETVNKIIEPYINRTIGLSLDTKKDAIEMNAFTNDKSCVNVFSGAESFITDLAFKITLGYYSAVSKTSMIFIDEAMSCLDAEKIKNIETFLEFLRTHYDCSFLISHIQEMKQHTPNTIEINKIGNKSYISI